MLPASRLFLACLILPPCKRKRHVPPKRWLTFAALHAVIFQKIGLFHRVCAFYLYVYPPLLHDPPPTPPPPLPPPLPPPCQLPVHHISL
jgi:hypothetical protein